MTKNEFLSEMRSRLSGLPADDIEERLTFYADMIDDRMEDGLPEETAVSELGDMDELLSQIVADIPLTKLVKGSITTKRKRSVFSIVLLALGSPIWLSLLIAVSAVVLSLYAVLWSVLLSLWAVFAALAVCGLAGIVGGVYYAIGGNVLPGIAVTGAGLVCAGLSIFMFFVCRAVTRGILILTKKLAIRIKSCFIKKEGTV